MIAASGSLISCASVPVSAASVVTRPTWASSSRSSRACNSARRRSVMSRTMLRTFYVAAEDHSRLEEPSAKARRRRLGVAVSSESSLAGGGAASHRRLGSRTSCVRLPGSSRVAAGRSAPSHGSRGARRRSPKIRSGARTLGAISTPRPASYIISEQPQHAPLVANSRACRRVKDRHDPSVLSQPRRLTGRDPTARLEFAVTPHAPTDRPEPDSSESRPISSPRWSPDCDHHFVDVDHVAWVEA